MHVWPYDKNVPNSLQHFFQFNTNIHHSEVRNADDFRMPYGSLDKIRYSIRITGNYWNKWNILCEYMKKLALYILFHEV